MATYVSVGDAIQELLSKYKIDHKYAETKLIANWEHIMGKPIAAKTKKIWIKNRKLYVEIASAPLKNELGMARKKITGLLNEDFAKPVIDDIVFL